MDNQKEVLVLKLVYIDSFYLQCEVRLIEGDVFGDCKLSDRMEVAMKILPPIDPIEAYAIGLNYKKHAAVLFHRIFDVQEAKLPIPAFPAVFMKATTSITGPFDNIIVPKCASAKPEVEYELMYSIG